MVGYHAERARREELEREREHLLDLAAAQGAALRRGDGDLANDAWRSVPTRLQERIDARARDLALSERDDPSSERDDG